VEPSRPRAYGVLCLAVLCLATTWPVSKLALADATPIWFAASRAGLSALVSASLLLVIGRLHLPSRGDLPIVVSIAVLQLAGFFALTNLGLRYLPSGRAVVLAFTMTIWLVPMALLVGERIGGWRLAGVVAGLAGVAVLCAPLARGGGDRHLLAGTAFLLLAALAWALAIFHARHHRWRRSPLELLPWQMALATLLLALLAALLEPDGCIGTAPGTLLAVLYIGAVAGPLATWASNSAARGLPMLVNSLGFLAVPAIGIAASSLWLGEALTPSLVLGAALILLGIALVAIGAASPR
jgi:drug/metabolite transporter (DMT)-like permease